MPVNVNIDPSSVPSWLLALLLGGGLVAELLDNEAGPDHGLDPEACYVLCEGEVGSWNPYHCACRGAGEE